MMTERTTHAMIRVETQLYSMQPRMAGAISRKRKATRLRLVEGVAREGVDGVARVGSGDLLLAGNIGAGRVGAAEVVLEDGVGPVGLDGGIAVVRTLQEASSICRSKNVFDYTPVNQIRLIFS